jgi:hypothetical protein
MIWIYIGLLFIILLGLMFIRFKNKEKDPLGDLEIPEKMELNQQKQGRENVDN